MLINVFCHTTLVMNTKQHQQTQTVAMLESPEMVPALTGPPLKGDFPPTDWRPAESHFLSRWHVTSGVFCVALSSPAVVRQECLLSICRVKDCGRSAADPKCERSAGMSEAAVPPCRVCDRDIRWYETREVHSEESSSRQVRLSGLQEPWRGGRVSVLSTDWQLTSTF